MINYVADQEFQDGNLNFEEVYGHISDQKLQYPEAKPIKSALLTIFRSEICQFVIWMHHLLKLINLQISL